MLQKIFLKSLFAGLMLALGGVGAGFLATPSTAQISTQPISPQISPVSSSNLPALPSSGLIRATASLTTYLPVILKTGVSTSPSFCGGTAAVLSDSNIKKPNDPIQPLAVLESFESAPPWQVSADISGSGSGVAQSSSQAAAGTYSARAVTQSSGGRAQIRVNFSEPAGSHPWQERPGTWHWQLASVYLPSSTVANLGPTEYLTLAGLFPSAGGQAGWWLRVRQGGGAYCVRL